MERLEEIRKKNKFHIYSCNDPAFLEFGRIISGFNFDAVNKYIDEKTIIPEKGNIYVASDNELEKLEVFSKVKNSIYGGMDIQFGYCNGNNSFLNGLEYHKGSEINVAVTELILLLAHTNDINKHEIESSKIKAFYLPKGIVIELFQTTLHFAPCKLLDNGFKCLVALPKGTNLDLKLEEKQIISSEDKFLFKQNKWLLVHEAKQDLISKGAHKGIVGENIEVKY
ncbi:MAG: DUF4867 family protein [Fusobacteriaceae bacterium]